MFKPYKFRVNRGRLQKDFRYRTVEGGEPLISWGVLGGAEGAFQSAYRVCVSYGKTELWNSGWVESTEQSARYAGKVLPRGVRVDFSVMLRDNFGNESEEGCDWFIRGDAGDWNAVWIGASEDIRHKPIYFRRDFTVDDETESACLYLCGLGYHKAYLNGIELDISLLDPAHSDYTKTCYYAVVPIDRALLRQGVNTLGVIVAEGWRRNDEGMVPKALGERKVAFFGPQQLAARLELRTAAGKVNIDTGDGWLWTHGAITESNIFNGETYDASCDIPGWNLPGEVPECFKDAVILPSPGGKLRPMTLEPIREGLIFRPVEIYRLREGVHIVDFGQNIAGVVRLRLPSRLSRGQTITVAHAEILDENGDLYTAPLREAKATDTYIASGDERDLDVWQPMFTYHGFRYVRVEGLELIDPADLCAVMIHTDLENGSFFSCGSALVNQIHKNIVMTERDNMHSILTDCPQRDERMQWLNDATVRFEETPYNFEIGLMFPKIVRDVIDAQHEDGAFTCCSPYVFGGLPADPVCSSFLIAGREALKFMGDVDTIRTAYAHFEAWEKLLLSRSTDYIVDYSYYGDWAGPGYACAGGEEGAVSAVTPGQLMSTGYSYFNSMLLADFARLLGMPDAERCWTETAGKIRDAFLKQWYDPSTGMVATGSQGAHAFALWLDILPEEGRQKTAELMRENLIANDYRITTGNLCSRYLLDMLAKYGFVEDAWKILTREEYPSFGYEIQNEATTIWERFELKKNPGMNSHCHPMYGAAGYWLYAWLCGIRNVRDGFASFDVDPVYPAGLLHAHAVVDTPRGDLSVKWTRRYGKMHLYVNVPFGCEAHIKAGKDAVICRSGFYAFEWKE